MKALLSSVVQALRLLLVFGLFFSSILLVSIAEGASLIEIYDLARSHDPQLRSARAVSRAEAEVVIQRRSALLPELNFTAETGYRHSNPGRFNDGKNDSYRISMTMPILNVERWHSFKAGELLSSRAATQLAEVNQTLIQRTMMAYMDVLETQSIHSTAVAIESAVFRRVDQVQSQYEAGLVTVTEVGEATAAYDVARVRQIIAKGELENSFEALFRLTGQRSIEQIDALKSNYPIELLQPYSPQVWVDRALQHNLALQLGRFDVEVTQKNLKSIKARHYPTLNFVANYGSETDAVRDGRDVDSGFVGINFSVPLFQGGRTSSEVRESFHRRDATVEVLADLRLDVAEKTRTVLRSLNNDVISIAAHRQAVLSAQSALTANDVSYQVGTRSIDEVLIAEQRAQETARDYDVARYTYVRNQIRLKELLGGLRVDEINLLDSWLGAPNGAQPLFESNLQPKISVLVGGNLTSHDDKSTFKNMSIRPVVDDATGDEEKRDDTTFDNTTGKKEVSLGLLASQSKISHEETLSINHSQNSVAKAVETDNLRFVIGIGDQAGVFAEGQLSYVNDASSAGAFMSIKDAPDAQRFVFNSGFEMSQNTYLGLGVARLRRKGRYQFGGFFSDEINLGQTSSELVLGVRDIGLNDIFDGMKLRVNYHDTESAAVGVIDSRTDVTDTHVQTFNILGYLIGGKRLTSQLETSLRLFDDLKMTWSMGYEKLEFDRDFVTQTGVTGGLGLAYRPSSRHLLTGHYQAGRTSNINSIRYEYIWADSILTFVQYESIKHREGVDPNITDQLLTVGLSIPLDGRPVISTSPLYQNEQKAITHERLKPGEQLNTEMLQISRATQKTGTLTNEVTRPAFETIPNQTISDDGGTPFNIAIATFVTNVRAGAVYSLVQNTADAMLVIDANTGALTWAGDLDSTQVFGVQINVVNADGSEKTSNQFRLIVLDNS